MKKRKHLQTNFFKFIVEKYNREMQDELAEEETNVSDEEIIDDIEESEETKRKLNQDDDFDLDEMIEEYNKLTEKHKQLKDDYSLYKRK